MRTVLQNVSQVIHYWANRVQAHGKSGNVFFEDGRIYSYGRHFCMARHLPGGAVAISTATYSVTTSSHQSAVHSAVRHLPRVYCHDAGAIVHVNRAHAITEIENSLIRARLPRIRATTRAAKIDNAQQVLRNFNEYLAALPTDEQCGIEPIGWASFEARAGEFDTAAADIEAMRKKHAENERERIKLMQLSQAEKAQQWRDGAAIPVQHIRAFSPMLRLSADGAAIQTSWGAEIPAAECPRIWALVTAAMAAGREAYPNAPCGVYTLNEVRADGSIRVGCHTIEHGELRGIAQKLGYLSL